MLKGPLPLSVWDKAITVATDINSFAFLKYTAEVYASRVLEALEAMQDAADQALAERKVNFL